MYYSIPLRLAASLFILGCYWFVSDLARINRLPTGYYAPLFVLAKSRETKVENEIRSTRERWSEQKFSRSHFVSSPLFSFLLFVGEIIATRHFATAGS